jgi:NTP pyrophosphatase (non-canonical NTP hydrolase)
MEGWKNGGWFSKYIIQKRSGHPVDPKAKYFVLRFDKDPHALRALFSYMESVRVDNPKFACDIGDRIKEHRNLLEATGDLHNPAFYIGLLAAMVNLNALNHGFWEPDANPAEKIALMHSELSEALEALRKDPTAADHHCPEFSNVVIELADCVIRIFDFCAQYKLPIGQAVIAKHEFNKTRPFKHGKKF